MIQMKPNKNFVQKIALERICRLFELAEEEFEKKPEFAKKCIEFARKISTRNRARIPQELKQKFCKKCGAFLKNGKNCKIEKIEGLLKIKCLECNFERKTNPGKQKSRV
jgi:ribonuclease P protein subunit RPR2